MVCTYSCYRVCNVTDCIKYIFILLFYMYCLQICFCIGILKYNKIMYFKFLMLNNNEINKNYPWNILYNPSVKMIYI
jgi:hypothetical protein